MGNFAYLLAAGSHLPSTGEIRPPRPLLRSDPADHAHSFPIDPEAECAKAPTRLTSL